MFVANRVSKIQELSSDVKWYHIDKNNNPADIVSRGMLPEELSKSNMWFFGPTYLKNEIGQWPRDNQLDTNKNVPEKRNCEFSFVVQKQMVDIFEKIKYVNDFEKLLYVACIFAYIFLHIF